MAVVSNVRGTYLCGSKERSGSEGGGEGTRAGGESY